MQVRPFNSSRWAFILVFACGLLLGYFILRTYARPKEHQHQLDFGDARWIESPEPGPIAYFRKEVFLSSAAEQAYIKVSATDYFQLTINGKALGSEGAVKTRVAGIYDVKRPLRAGTNVIGVFVSRGSYPGRAQMLLSGFIKQPGSPGIRIISDEQWRVTNRRGIIPPTQEWNSRDVQDQLWPTARFSGLGAGSVPINWVDSNPLLFELPPAGSWIMADNAVSEAIFSTNILAKHRQETWIQVASPGNVDVLVNSHLVTPPIPVGTEGSRLPHIASTPPPSTPPPSNKRAPVTSRANEKAAAAVSPVVFYAYDITHWIKNGTNSIVLAVRCPNGPALVLANGFVVGNDGKAEQFQTDGHWQTGDESLVHGGGVRRPAVVLGRNGMAPWGYVSQEIARTVDQTDFGTLVGGWGFMLVTAGILVALWLLFSSLIADWTGESLSRVLLRDGLFHGLVLIGLVLLFLPNYDYRFPEQWSFQPRFVIGAILLLFALRLLHFPREGQITRWLRTRLNQLRAQPWQFWIPYAILGLIVALGFALRFHNLAYMSFDHDEMGLVTKSKGIFKLGIPYTIYAGEVRWITTYEAVPYPLALSGFLFGYSEWSMRLPSCLMGTMTIAVLALFGRRLFNWKTGLFAAFIYACLPLNVRWAQNAFYLSQCQLLATLTFWFFYEAILTRPLRRNYLTAASVTFCLTYLSWEGTGFILPALCIALIVVRWGEWWWLKEFHLYRCLFWMGVVVVAQYCSRMLAGEPYLQVGSGLSNLTGPSLFFLTPNYVPMFYVDKLLLSENHVFFTIFLVAGLPFFWRQGGFRYVVTILLILFLLHTNFIAALSPRYCYYFQPLLVMSGVAAAMMFYDRITALIGSDGDRDVVRGVAHITGFALLLLLFLQSNELLLHEYQLSSTGDTPQLMSRFGLYRYDYRGADEYVKEHLLPGDIVLPGIPHVYAYYAGQNGDYFLDTLFASKVPYDQTLVVPGFIDKFSGLPIIRNLTEFRQVVSHSRRTWVIFTPYSSMEKLNSPDVVDYLAQNGRTQFESYRSKVFLIEGASHEMGVAQAP